MIGMIGGFLASKILGPVGDIAMGVGQSVIGFCQQHFGKDARAHRKERKEMRKEAKKLKEAREMSPTAIAMANRFKGGDKPRKAVKKSVDFEESRHFQD